MYGMYMYIVYCRTVTPCDGHVICCHANSNTGTVAVELQDGSVYSYKGMYAALNNL